MTLGELNWKKVITKDRFVIGQVEGAEVDPNGWQMTHVHIGLNDEATKRLGLRRPFLGRVLICLPVDVLTLVEDSVMVMKSFDELKKTKECQEFNVNK